MYYVLSLCGYEDYQPVWFESNFSKEEFEKSVKKAVKDIVDRALTKDDLINGHTIMDTSLDNDGIDLLKEGMGKLGFRMIKPDLEIMFEGVCLYNKYSAKKPSIFSDDDWVKILEHNDRLEVIEKIIGRQGKNKEI